MARPYAPKRRSKEDRENAPPPRGTMMRPRKDGTEAWYARFVDSRGKEVKEYAGNKMTDALSLYRRRKAEVEEGRYQAAQRGELVVYTASVLDHYLPILQAEHSSPRNDTTLHKFWRERIGDVPLSQVTRGMIAGWRAEALKKWEPSGVQRKVAWLRKVLSLCVADGVLPHHPLQHLKGLELPDSTAWHFLTLEERLRLRDACRTRKRGLWALVYFALVTGLRQHELFSLLWEHVDLPRLVLTIPSRRGARSAGSRKRRKARRVPAQAVEHILQQRWIRRENAGGGPWVFPRPGDPTQHVSGNAVYKRHFKPAAIAAGLPNLRWQDLRHTFVSDRLDAGDDVRLIQEMAGHTDIRTTLKYLHLRQGREAEASARARHQAEAEGWSAEESE